MNDYSKQELEKILETILEGTLAGFWDWDIPNNKEFLSPRFKSMLGFKEHELENCPESWQKLIFKKDLQGVMKNFEDHINSKGKIPFHNEVRYQHKNGSTLHIICAGKVVEWKDKEPLRMIGVHVDVTELRRAQSAEKAKEDFMHIISHELRTPLNGIMGMAQLLQDEEDIQKKYAKEMSVIFNSGRELLSRIDDILSINDTRLSTYQEFSLSELIENVVGSYKQILKKKEIDLSVKIDENVPCQLISSPVRIKQLVNNLINNAVKFAHESKIRIKAKLSKKDVLVLSVSDSGKGISKEKLKNIFEAFATGDTSITRKHSGIGLGLTICKKICEDLGGSIKVDSEPEKGSTFTAEIPVYCI